MTYETPEQPENSFRVTLDLETPQESLSIALMHALKEQTENETLQQISKTQLKKLFIEKKVLIKGQNAKVKSPINSGITYIDILLE